MKILEDIHLWDCASSKDRLAVVQLAGAALPAGFELDAVSECTLGDQSHEIGFFQFDGCRFALIPGSKPAVLGYDNRTPIHLSDDQLKDWQITESAYGQSIEAYLEHYLTPVRHVPIEPVLVEVAARRYEYDQDGNNQIEGYHAIRAHCENGFRLPSSDEWEYFCSGGSRALFRWGDDCPLSNSYHEKAWDRHKRPNAFGLYLNASTYDSEICRGPKLRGGDGGSAVCGGMGHVATWLPFASSFCVPDDEVAYWYIEDVFVRRVHAIYTSG